jgi:transaldolase
MTNALQNLSALGTSIWLDDLSRSRLTNPESDNSLKNLIENYCVVGVTTNPSIFDNALKDSLTYGDIFAVLKSAGASVDQAIRKVTTTDVRDACDLLLDTFRKTQGIDGRVSIEVDPRLAHKTQETIEQARELWTEVGRENLFIKVPATLAGLPAIELLISEGISVNVTLIFSTERYEKVLLAYVSGLEKRLAAGSDVSHIQSVASFFVSRVDTAIDPILDRMSSDKAAPLRGKAAVANAHLAYEIFLSFSQSDRWKKLASSGAWPQRLLWASTGVKDPTYKKDKYVSELAAPLTVNTMPEATLRAVQDLNPVIKDSITTEIVNAHLVLRDLSNLGIDYNKIVNDLEVDGIKKFEESWQHLLQTVEQALA